MSYHIKADGRPGVCEATVRPCPRGGKHYGTELEAAHAAIEIALSKQGGGSGGKFTTNIEGMNAEGVAYEISRAKGLHPDELTRLAKENSGQVQVLREIMKHKDVDSRTVATVLSYASTDRYVLVNAAYNRAVKPEMLDSLIEYAPEMHKEAVWDAVADRKDLLDNHKEFLSKTTYPVAALRYARGTTSTEHLDRLAKSDIEYAYGPAIENPHTTEKTLWDLTQDSARPMKARNLAGERLATRVKARLAAQKKQAEEG